MAKDPEVESIDISALANRPEHLQAMGLLNVEINRMEREVSDLFGVILGIHPFLAEAIYFTSNSAIARMDIVGNAADMALIALPQELKAVHKLIGRAKAVMGKRHSIIHAYWMTHGDEIRREKLGEFKNKRVVVVTLKELNQMIGDTQVLANDIGKFRVKFRENHPTEIGALKDYWAEPKKPKKKS